MTVQEMAVAASMVVVAATAVVARAAAAPTEAVATEVDALASLELTDAEKMIEAALSVPSESDCVAIALDAVPLLVLRGPDR